MNNIDNIELLNLQSKIKFLLTISGISQDEACSFLDITKQTLNNIENLKVSMTLPQVMALDTLLAVKASSVPGLNNIIKYSLNLDMAALKKPILECLIILNDSPHQSEFCESTSKSKLKTNTTSNLNVPTIDTTSFALGDSITPLGGIISSVIEKTLSKQTVTK